MFVSDLTVRIAAPDDAVALAELAAETFPLACTPGTTAEAIAEFIAAHFTVAQFEQHLSDHARILLVAQEPEPGARLIGYAMLVTGEPADVDAAAAVTARPTIELSKFYTRAAAHGSGVAALLMGASIDAATARGAASMWLGTNEQNVRALRFYEKHAFRRVGRKRFKLGDRLEHDWVLERPLERSLEVT
jgi:diamine N-acetyltransferase